MASVFEVISPKDWRQTVQEFNYFEVKRFLLNPQQWVTYPNRLPTLRWKRVKFDKAGVRKLPESSGGLYSFIAEPRIAGHRAVGYLLYVGETHR